jgi:hypothetical protein
MRNATESTSDPFQQYMEAAGRIWEFSNSGNLATIAGPAAANQHCWTGREEICIHKPNIDL